MFRVGILVKFYQFRCKPEFDDSLHKSYLAYKDDEVEHLVLTESDTSTSTLTIFTRFDIKCHFDDSTARVVRLHFTRDEVFAA